MRVRPYRLGDLEHIVRRPHDDFGPESWENTKQQCDEHPTYTFEDDGIPVAVIGCELIWTGVFNVWAIVSDQVRGSGLQLTKTAKELLEGHAKAAKAWRAQTVIKQDIPENIKWIELLGFKRESVMYRAAPEGTNLLMYVRYF